MPATTPLGFTRSSVVDQTAAALRAAIRKGDLREPLPGGHQLARLLGVSRPTVRSALLRLATEGVLVVEKGRRSRLAKKSRRSLRAAQPSVCLICPAAFGESAIVEHPLLLEMHAEFASRGVRWEVLFEARLGGVSSEMRLKQAVAARPDACWILFSVAEPIQRWFAAANVPVLVLGSCAPGLKLPSADLNYGAVGWHAAGTIVRHGHKRIGLILPARPLPGDLASRERFREYLRQQAPDVAVRDWNAPDHIGQRRVAFDRLFADPQRPTALLSLRPALTFAVLLHAPGLGVRFPRDISLVSRDSHALFELTVPELTRYSSAAIKLALRAVKLAEHLLQHRSVPTEPSLVMPTFVPGGTLGKCREV